jgi:predicted ATPase/class 3 adenylate cyclase/DNA-binding CsgD family transcriptional regulator
MEPRPSGPVTAGPVGTMTFLFSDVQASTQLWERHPGPMREALARHDRLLRDAIEGNGGQVVKTTGDGVLAVFAAAHDSLRAAVAAQLALSAEAWAGLGRLRVRIGVHTGEAEVRDGDYFGAAVNRAARLMAVAHGGQVVVSHATEGVVRDALASELDLLDLGEQRLEGLTRPERVFQVCHPDLERDFPPLRSITAPRTNLPVQLTSFVGREAEVVEVRRLLADSRLVVLTGSGGCGKTRLAVEVARRVADGYPDGVWFVDLAAVSDPASVPDVARAALGLSVDPGRPVLESLVDQLSGWQTLLVVDNCEHVIGACAAFADRLLRACPNVTILATSRERLAVEGESAWRVPSLSVPDTVEPTPQSIAGSEAGRLFAERAAKSRPNFAITEDNCGAIAEICQHLDGIPLAIELAAARTRVLVPEQIAEGLADRLDLLGHGVRSGSLRHQTLAASIEWSHELLDERERILFRRLSVFAGGFTLDAAEQVGAAAPIERYAVLEVLTGLVDKSLVLMEDHPGGARFRMLETIRHYAADQLSTSDEEAEIRKRHLAVFLELAEEAEPALRGPDQTRWVGRLETEHANLRIALDWSAQDQPELNLRLGSALAFFWSTSGPLSERHQWVRDALVSSSDIRPELRGKALLGVARLALGAGDLERAVTAAQESLVLARKRGAAEAIGQALEVLGMIVLVTDPSTALQYLEESIEIARTVDDTWTICDALNWMGLAHFLRGDFARLEPVSRECIDYARKAGLKQQIGRGLLNLSSALLLQGDLRQAQSVLEASTEELRDSNTPFLGATLSQLAESYSLQGEYADAGGALDEALEIGHRIGSPFVIITSRFSLGRLALALGDTESARSHLNEAVGFSRQLGIKLWLSWHLRDLGIATLLVGEWDAARGQLDEALTVARDLDASQPIAAALYGLGLLASHTDEIDQAEQLWHEALRLFTTAGDIVGVIDTLEALAATAASQDSLDEATRLFAATAAARDRLGYRRPSPNHAQVKGQLDRLPVELDPDDYASRWEEGQALALDAATAYASRARGERKRPSSGWPSLTPTELDVVRLVALGLTNKVVAERLFIAPSTVKTHLSSVFAKLGVTTRSELTAEAIRRDAVEPG